MTSSRPYLLEAFLDWICDNGCTPYVVVDADFPDAKVPEQYIDDGKIVLNVSPDAVRDFALTKTSLEFSATFAGVPTHVFAPMQAILAIYAQENGRGMVFKDDDNFDDFPPSGGNNGSKGDDKGGKGKGDGSRPNLTVVK